MVAVERHQPESSVFGVLAWRFPQPVSFLSSAPVGGGFGSATWVTNIQVPVAYQRRDLDVHAAEVAAELDLSGEGVTLFTAANVDRRGRGEHGSAVVDATCGISKPTWAADPAGGWSDWEAGTINIVAQSSVGLTPAAAVNAVITITEAKTQALLELGVPGTGTASDAVVVTWPTDDPTPALFAGPRSDVGAALAIATHGAVTRSIGAVDR